MTPLDAAHAEMSADPEDDGARLRFYDRFAGAELMLLLERPAEGGTLAPRLFPLEDGPVVLAFDTEERLVEFAGETAYAALSGRALAAMLAGQGIGVGLNLDVAPSAYLIPDAAIDWLAGMLSARPEAAAARPVEIAAPRGLPDVLLSSIDAKLAGAEGLARAAYLAAVTYADGRRGHMLAFADALEGAETALAQAISEALIFSGLDAGELDVTFVASDDPVAARLGSVALRFDLPQSGAGPAPAAPGTDPERPPRLR